MSEFYARKHKDNLNRLIVTRDICQQKVVELEEEVRTKKKKKRANKDHAKVLLGIRSACTSRALQYIATRKHLCVSN